MVCCVYISGVGKWPSPLFSQSALFFCFCFVFAPCRRSEEKYHLCPSYINLCVRVRVNFGQTCNKCSITFYIETARLSLALYQSSIKQIRLCTCTHIFLCVLFSIVLLVHSCHGLVLVFVLHPLLDYCISLSTHFSSSSTI